MLYQAFELQPKDQERSNAISLLLLGQIRAKMGSDRPISESLIETLKRIRPQPTLTAGYSRRFSQKRTAAQSEEVQFRAEVQCARSLGPRS